MSKGRKKEGRKRRGKKRALCAWLVKFFMLFFSVLSDESSCTTFQLCVCFFPSVVSFFACFASGSCDKTAATAKTKKPLAR